MVVTIKTESVPNAHMRVFHTRHRWQSSMIYASNLSFCDDVCQTQMLLMKELFAIQGVEYVATREYAVDIQKGQMLSWEELEPLILNKITTYILRSQTE